MQCTIYICLKSKEQNTFWYFFFVQLTVITSTVRDVCAKQGSVLGLNEADFILALVLGARALDDELGPDF